MLHRTGRELAGLLGAASLALAAAPASAAPNAAEATLARAEQVMMIDPKQAVSLVVVARGEIAGITDERAAALAHARALWLEGEALSRLGRSREGEAEAREALKLAERWEPSGRLNGRILTTLGGIALDEERVRDAFDRYKTAYRIFVRTNDLRNQAVTLQNIGSIYNDAGDHARVLRYYAQSATLYPQDRALAVAAHNNVGLAYKEMGQPARAVAEYRLAFTEAERMNSPLLQARVLTNLAWAELARGRFDAAEAAADRGLGIAARGKVEEWSAFLRGAKAQVALARGDKRRAVRLFDALFRGVDLDTTSFYYRDIHAAAAEAYRGAGQPDEAFRHLAALKRLDDEAREIRSSTNAALSAAQFDFSAQELRIARLQREKLERDVAIGRARARLTSIVSAATLLLLAITLAGFFSVRRSRNQTRAANRELATSNTALDRALTAKSEFLATTSHEIRTPLNGILGMTQVLLQGRGATGEVRDQIKLIDSAGTAMKAIVDDILDMAKIERGTLEVARDVVALTPLLGETAAIWVAEAGKRDIAVTATIGDLPARIFTDERKLRQILFNLLSNAVKFTMAGQVTLAAHMVGDAGAERLLVTIADTGCGIPPDQLEAIFEPFFQVDTSRTRQVSGTGLGLAICANLAAAMGGRITVESVPGEGSSFTLSLPIERAAAVADAATGERKVAASLAEAAVLVAEANPLLRSMAAALLEDEVDTVLAVDALDEAIAAARQGVDLIVLDYATAVDWSDAAEVLRALRPAGAPIVLLAGEEHLRAAEDAVEGALAAHAMLKQVPPMTLPAVLAELLARWPRTPATVYLLDAEALTNAA